MATRMTTGIATARSLWAFLLTSFLAACTWGENLTLVNAVESQDWPLAKKLLHDNAAVNQAQPDGMTALHWAVYRNHEETVERLLKANADANAKTRYGVTPLVIASFLKFINIQRKS